VHITQALDEFEDGHARFDLGFEAAAVERLPVYAPELNPVEYIWGYWKHHELPNFCPRDFGQLSYQARPCGACAAAHAW
jgi:transposase